MNRQRLTAKAFSCCSFVFGKFWNNFIFKTQLNPNFSSTTGHTTHLPPAQMGWSSHESKAKRNWNNKEIKDDINLFPGLVNTNLFCFFSHAAPSALEGVPKKAEHFLHQNFCKIWTWVIKLSSESMYSQRYWELVGIGQSISYQFTWWFIRIVALRK